MIKIKQVQVLVVLFLMGFTQVQAHFLRGVISMQGQELVFSLSYESTSGKVTMHINNADEQILIEDITYKGDTICARLPIFDSELRFKQIGSDSLNGYWHNYSKGKVHEFKASTRNAIQMTPESTYGLSREATKKFDGRWEVDFSPGTADSSKAIGIFENKGYCMKGTFLTPTGDYRYLQGTVDKDTMYLSCFDGSHAFIFKAVAQKDGTIKGVFRSGAAWNEPWTAKRNEAYELPDPDKLTFMKPGYDKLAFTFPDLDKQHVSLTDARFKNKVVIVQIMGSWCPNCMDESAFMTDFYKKHKAEGLEIVGLAYERTRDMDKAIANVNRLKQRFGIAYPLLIAGYSDKTEAAKTLPMLNHIMSFPTTIIIDRSGKVVKIHTGFSGPATGKYYEKFVSDFTDYIDKLMK